MRRAEEVDGQGSAAEANDRQVAAYPGHLCSQPQGQVHPHHVQHELRALPRVMSVMRATASSPESSPSSAPMRLAVASLSAAVSTATTVVAELSARRIWIAIWPSPPAPMTTAVEPGPSRWSDRLTA